MQTRTTHPVDVVNAAAGRNATADRVLLRLLLETSRAGTFDLDLKTGLIQIDERAKLILHIKSDAPLHLTTLAEMILPEDRQIKIASYGKTIANRETFYEDEFKIRSPDSGRVIWLHVKAQILYQQLDHDAPRFTGIVMDVTDGRIAEDVAKEGRAKVQAILNSVPQLIWTTDANGRQIYANAHCRKYHCAITTEKRAQFWMQTLHPEDAPKVISRWNACVISGEKFEAEYRLRDATEQYRWFLGRVVPVRDENGVITEWFGTAVDIDEKKQAEFRKNLIQQKVMQLQSIATALAVAHKPIEVAQVVVEQGLEPVEADAGFIVLSEPDRESISLLYASGYTQTELEQIKSLTRSSSYLTADAIRRSEAIFISGNEIQRAAAALPLLVQGQAIGALVVSYNSSMKFSDELVSYLTILAEQCAQAIERARLFDAEQTARKNAEIASRVKTQFLMNMSHEIRTPMNSILGFADLLGDKTLTNEEREEFRSRIRMNGDQLMRLIDDMLDLSKAESGKIQIEKVSFSVTDLTRDVLESMSSKAQKKNIRTRMSTDKSVPAFIESDPVRLRQILTNLLGNAIKFTDHGRIETRISMKESDLIIEVEDTGIGISPDLHQRLFKAFSQGDNSVTRRFGGSGLGLAVSRSIAEAMGGTLDLVHSETRRGSIFRLTIPLEVPAYDPQIDMFATFKEPVNVESKGNELEGVNVLLVEDSFDNEMLIRAYLKGTGVRLEVARNGEEAVARALDKKFDVVFMDIQMPVMDGLEATRRLKSRNYLPPIVALSAHALPEEVERSLAAGCHSHLTKPILRTVLIEQIRTLAANQSS